MERKAIWISRSESVVVIQICRAREVVSSGSFPGLFQEIFHFRVRSIRTPGMHLKGNREPYLFPECCPVLNNI